MFLLCSEGTFTQQPRNVLVGRTHSGPSVVVLEFHSRLM